MTTHLPPRTEYWYCQECGSRYPSQSAARHCADEDLAESD